MTNADSWSKYQHNLDKTLDFLANGGSIDKASILLEKADNYRPALFNKPGHPVAVFRQENQLLETKLDQELLPTLKKWQQNGQNAELKQRLNHELTEISQISRHYKRKENSLFPLLVKYQLLTEDQTTQLWQKDDAALTLLEQAQKVLAAYPATQLYQVEAAVEQAAQALKQSYFAENAVILPLLCLLLKPEEWYMVKQDEIEIGYSWLKEVKSWRPDPAISEQVQAQLSALKGQAEFKQIMTAYKNWVQQQTQTSVSTKPKAPLTGDADYLVGTPDNSPALVFKDIKQIALKLEVGSLNLNEIPAIFNVLPLDLTFVDAHDRVKWFSNSDRVFPRTRSVIGRPVIRCHPPKSIDLVLKILSDFHKGYADSEDFWVDVHGRKIYLCFYAVRDSSDHYLGCLETVQDITRLQTLTGTKTLENRQ